MIIIQKGMKLNEVEELNFMINHQYSMPKEQIITAANSGTRYSKNIYQPFYYFQAEEVKGFLLDVRTPLEYDMGTINGATNIELDSIRDNIDKLPSSKEEPIYVFCQAGLRANIALNILKANGYTNL